jgi:hypothetical protein
MAFPKRQNYKESRVGFLGRGDREDWEQTNTKEHSGDENVLKWDYSVRCTAVYIY